MISRRLLLGAGAATIAVAAARPSRVSGGHSPYFASLNGLLRKEGIDRPVLMIDLDRLDRNIDRLTASAAAGTGRTLRIAVKSVPAPGLVDYIGRRSGSGAGMVFHRPFLEEMAVRQPGWNYLLGKPMPVAALAGVYDRLQGVAAFDPSRQLRWLIDTETRLAQYLAFADQRALLLRVSLEIDVGLHRGGFATPAALAGVLATIAAHPDRLVLGGLMGYDGHILGLPEILRGREADAVKSRYAAFADLLRRDFPALTRPPGGLVLNGSGSPSFRYHETGSPLTDISVGSALMKPSHYDLPALTDFEASSFIATPVLKRGADQGVPTMEWLGGPMRVWDPNSADILFAYGGNWLADPVSPAGVSRSGIYESSNQAGYHLSQDVILATDDFLFLRPTQSEAVLLQFGDLLGVRGDRIETRWPVLQSS
ncbi:MAG: DSD1 family PLP-dependent enzyme [Telmatospirillum sp.]|nr:DSD1 family PLP-dependent enzyme [Telmatospirillum sp.]